MIIRNEQAAKTILQYLRFLTEQEQFYSYQWSNMRVYDDYTRGLSLEAKTALVKAGVLKEVSSKLGIADIRRLADALSSWKELQNENNDVPTITYGRSYGLLDGLSSDTEELI